MALSLQFIGSNPAVIIEGRKEEQGIVNFFIGNDPAKWRTGLHSCAEIVYRDLWPGIDLVYRKTGGVLKYEYIIRPGADLNSIRLTYGGADNLVLDDNGNLLIHTPLGILTELRPVSYRPDDDQCLPVATAFTLERCPDGTMLFGFTVGAGYDPAGSLIIDPGLIYSTYLGGSGGDEGYGIAVDTGGNVYVTGYTDSNDFPTTPDAFQSVAGGYTFVTKLDAAGALSYSTYLGGSNDDEGMGIAIDSSGHAYITGYAHSDDFPTTAGAVQTSLNGCEDAFVTKLNPTGSALVYSTYLGGSGYDEGFAIAVDASGSAYVTGYTTSDDFPTSAGAFQSTFGGKFDAFVTKLNVTGSALVYSTYLGGSGREIGYGIAADSAGHTFVAGYTDSADFPVTADAVQSTLIGYENAFVAKLNAAGTALVYSTYLGGSGRDESYGIAVDSAGHAYITGYTDSGDFPVTADAVQSTRRGYSDAFVSKLNPAGTALVYSTYLGGSGDDEGYGIAVDSAGHAYVTGATASDDFPVTADALQSTYGGGWYNAFVSKLGSPLLYSTYLGGSGWDEGRAIAVDRTAHAYITGYTSSPDFPTTAGAVQTSLSGYEDAFVAKLSTIGGECGAVLSNSACRLNLGLDTPNGPNNPVPDYACHDVCVREVTMIASQEVHQVIPYPPVGRCRLGPGLALPPLTPNQQCSLFVTCAGEVLGADCASVIDAVGLLAICVAASGAVVAIPLPLVLTFSTFYDFPTGARLYFSQVRARLREIDGSCKLIQIKAAVNSTADAILIDGKIVDKLWKHENLWLSGLRPYDLDQSQRDQGFISLTVGSTFANGNQAIVPCSQG